MRMNDLTRYFDKYIGFDTVADRIDDLQERLAKLRERLPEASVPVNRIREALPSYRDVRGKLPFMPKPKRHTLPAALAVGGVAILGAIVVTAVLMSDVNKRVPKSNEDMH